MALLILCLKVFFVRIFDVSMGTLRTIITVKGKNLYASLVGFFEVFIWFVVVKEALNTDETSIFIAISYALGFATGTYIGGVLSKKFITSNLSIQIITSEYQELAKTLREKGFGVSVINIEGIDDKKDRFMLFIETDDKKLNMVERIAKQIDKKAFIVVNETKYVQNGFMNNVAK